jgi:hypothetical protein
LVGGPSSSDQPDDVTTDLVLNEVAVDNNLADEPPHRQPGMSMRV